MKQLSPLGAKIPLIVAFVLLVSGGVFLLEREEAQARDTIRKHHLQDIEQSLYFARNIKGTFPPYDEAAWCGVLTTAGNEKVLAEVEEMLRAQNKKYANLDKPFPRDPQLRNGGLGPDYFYWKHSPASFELYSILEVDRNGERSTQACQNSDGFAYDYGIASIWREN